MVKQGMKSRSDAFSSQSFFFPLCQLLLFLLLPSPSIIFHHGKALFFFSSGSFFLDLAAANKALVACNVVIHLGSHYRLKHLSITAVATTTTKKKNQKTTQQALFSQSHFLPLSLSLLFKKQKNGSAGSSHVDGGAGSGAGGALCRSCAE